MIRLAETKSTCYFEENGILVSRWKPGREVDLQDVIQNFEVRQTFILPYPVPILMDIRDLKDITLEAIFAATNQRDADNFSAAALLVFKPLHDLVAREANRFRKAYMHRFRTFHEEQQAFTWLQQFKHHSQSANRLIR